MFRQYNKKLIFFDKILFIMVFLFINIFPSPILQIIKFPIWKSCILVLLFLCLYYLLLNRYKKVFHISFVYLFLITLILASVTAIYYQSLYGYYPHLFFLVVVIFFFFYRRLNIDSLITYSTIFMWWLIAGAYIGFIYGYIGGKPIFSFPNPDGRNNNIYLTTFTNVVYLGNTIRPAGVYDEPGAFSFFICALCLLRTLYQKNEKNTFFLLLAGLITTSLTHVIILVCYVGYLLTKKGKIKDKLIIITSLTIVIVFLTIKFYNVLDVFLLRRLEFNTATGTFNGEDRSSSFRYGLSLLNKKSFFWGLDKIGFSGDIKAFQKRFGSLGETPIRLLVQYGLFSSWYYYLFLSIVFLCGLINSKNFFIYLAICLLFFQRPYPSTLGYPFYFVIFFTNAISTIKKELSSHGKLKYFVRGVL